MCLIYFVSTSETYKTMLLSREIKYMYVNAKLNDESSPINILTKM